MVHAPVLNCFCVWPCLDVCPLLQTCQILRTSQRRQLLKPAAKSSPAVRRLLVLSSGRASSSSRSVLGVSSPLTCPVCVCVWSRIRQLHHISRTLTLRSSHCFVSPAHTHRRVPTLLCAKELQVFFVDFRGASRLSEHFYGKAGAAPHARAQF